MYLRFPRLTEASHSCLIVRRTRSSVLAGAVKSRRSLTSSALNPPFVLAAELSAVLKSVHALRRCDGKMSELLQPEGTASLDERVCARVCQENTHAHALFDISAACKQWVHMTAHTRHARARRGTSKESRSGAEAAPPSWFGTDMWPNVFGSFGGWAAISWHIPPVPARHARWTSRSFREKSVPDDDQEGERPPDDESSSDAMQHRKMTSFKRIEAFSPLNRIDWRD